MYAIRSYYASHPQTTACLLKKRVSIGGCPTPQVVRYACYFSFSIFICSMFFCNPRNGDRPPLRSLMVAHNPHLDPLLPRLARDDGKVAINREHHQTLETGFKLLKPCDKRIVGIPVGIIDHSAVTLQERNATLRRITSYNVCYTKLLRI